MKLDERYSFIPPPSQCHLLPDQMWQLEYHFAPQLTPDEYMYLMEHGWRRFGMVLFRPRCASCVACQPIRVPVTTFKPSRTQRRVHKANVGTELRVARPIIDEQRIDLFHRHHAHHAATKGWPEVDSDITNQILHITQGPFPIEEWSYHRDGKIVAISYIDNLRDAYSGIYFYHDPDYRHLSLGNWICLSMIARAAENKVPFVYYGYYVAGCRSMEYKGKFMPNQVLDTDGIWKDFLK